jgi:hypothetical protein
MPKVFSCFRKNCYLMFQPPFKLVVLLGAKLFSSCLQWHLLLLLLLLLLQLGCHSVAIVILHVYNYEIGFILNLRRKGYMRSM